MRLTFWSKQIRRTVFLFADSAGSPLQSPLLQDHEDRVLFTGSLNQHFVSTRDSEAFTCPHQRDGVTYACTCSTINRSFRSLVHTITTLKHFLKAFVHLIESSGCWLQMLILSMFATTPVCPKATRFPSGWLLLFQLTVETGRCHVNLRPRAPLHIGTIPLRNGDDLPQPPQPAATSPPLDTTQSSFHPLASTDFSAAQPAAYQGTAVCCVRIYRRRLILVVVREKDLHKTKTVVVVVVCEYKPLHVFLQARWNGKFLSEF